MEIEYTGMNGVCLRHVMTEFKFENPVMRALRNGVFREFNVVDKDKEAGRYFFDVELGPPPYKHSNTVPFPFYVLHWLTSEVWRKKIQTLASCIPPPIEHVFEKDPLYVDHAFIALIELLRKGSQ